MKDPKNKAVSDEIYNNAPDHYHHYFNFIESNDLLQELEKSKRITETLFSAIDPEKENYAYDVDKWTIKEVLQHIIDCERVFCYRAFRLSRFDSTELSGFDENQYIDTIDLTSISLSDLLDEYLNVRTVTIGLYKTMTDNMLDFKGTANNAVFTARSIGFMCIGHNLHHCKLIQTRYLANK